MKITDREKKLLLVFFMLLIAFLYYQFIYQKDSKTIDELTKEDLAAQERLLSINREISKASSERSKLEDTIKNIENIDNKLPPNQNTIFSILDLQRLSNIFNNNISDYNISTGNENNRLLSYFSFHQNWQMTYDDFKQLLNTQKNFDPLFSIQSATLTSIGERLNVDFEIRFYGYEDKTAKKRQLPSLSTGIGKKYLFK